VNQVRGTLATKDEHMQEQSERARAWHHAKAALEKAYPQATLTAFVREGPMEENSNLEPGKRFVFRASFDNGTTCNVRVLHSMTDQWFVERLSMDDIH
jgi:hypothetical protein